MKHPYYHAIMVWAEAPDEWVWQFLEEGSAWFPGGAPHKNTNRTYRLVPRAWLDDPYSVNVWLRERGVDDVWRQCVPGWVGPWDHETYEYDIRPRPRTITLPEREIPEPMREAPLEGITVFVVSAGCPDGYSAALWDGDSLYRRWLARGMIYHTAEDAAAAARAMCPSWEDGDE